jgi:hypothetical protein
MTNFPILTSESAPERSKPALQQLQSAFGMIPNIAGAMATSPVLINSLVGLFGNVHGGSFTEAQVQTVLLTDAVTNASTWAVAFHTTLALKEGIDPADVQAIRDGRLPGFYIRASSDTPKLNAFWRVAPSVRLRLFAILPARVFFRASDFKVRTSSGVQVRRFPFFMIGLSK